MDAAGNTSAASSALSITIDTSLPSTPYISYGPFLDTGVDSGNGYGNDLTNDTTPTLHGTATESSGKVNVYDQTTDTLLGTATIGLDSGWTFTVPADKALATQGAHDLTFTVIDTAGNESIAAIPLTVTLDTVAPTETGLPVVSSILGTVTLSFSERIVFGDNTVFTIHNLDNGSTETISAADEGMWSYLYINDVPTGIVLSPGMAGNLELTLTQGGPTDDAGNVAIVGVHDVTLVAL